jgi:hypothetical protein
VRSGVSIWTCFAGSVVCWTVTVGVDERELCALPALALTALSLVAADAAEASRDFLDLGIARVLV